jgi:hypothetical protein
VSFSYKIQTYLIDKQLIITSKTTVMDQQTIITLIWVSPLIIGGIIAAANSEDINEGTEKAEAWIRQSQSNSSKKKHSLNRYLINPVLYTLVWFSDWTDSFTHRGVKNGVRVAATLYIIAAWCFLIYTAFMIAIILIIAGVVIYVWYKILGVVFKVAVSSDNNFSRGYEVSRSIIDSNESNSRTDSEYSGENRYDIKYWDADLPIHMPFDDEELYGCEITDMKTGLVGKTHRARSSKTKAHDDAWEDLMKQQAEYYQN